MVTSAMATVTPAALMGSHSRSDPTSVTSISSRWIVLAMVTSLIGSAVSPSRIRRPSAPTEKSPDTAFTPL